MRSIHVQPGEPQTKSQRSAHDHLKRIQEEVGADQGDLVVGINLDTGEYVLGGDYGQAYQAFRKRFPDAARYICRLDGSPAILM